MANDLKAFHKWLEDINEELNVKAKAVVENATEDTCDMAKGLVHSDTGNLKNSLDTMYKNDGLTGYVYTVVEYAPYHEFGFIHYKSKKKVLGFSYMGQAYEKYYQKFIEDLKNLM